jgi:hypothetical protein
VVPRRLVSADCVQGTAPVPRDVRVSLQRRYADAAVLAADLAAVVRDGADGLLLTPSATVRAALAAPPPAPVWALLPNVPQYVRDSSDVGLLRAAIARMRYAGPRALVRLGVTAAARLHRIARGEFAGLLPLLLELEHAALGLPDVRAVTLAAPLTDLLLAAGNVAFFLDHLAFVRRRFGAAGFDTNNLGHLLDRFRAWGVAPDFVVGPLNPRGFLMKPTPTATLVAVERATVPVLAKHVTAAGLVGLDAGVAYAYARGAAGVVVDLAELRAGERAERPGPSA